MTWVKYELPQVKLELSLSLVIRCAKASSPTIDYNCTEMWHSFQNNFSTNWRLDIYYLIKLQET